MTSGAIPRSQDSHLPKIHYFGEVTSTSDVAFHLAEERRFADWDSVIARAQTEGRGQMRRHWESPPGNLYASVRLPLSRPFNSPAGSVAIGALCANALRSFGYPIELKWPNDLIIKKKESYAKCGGILLEQRNDCLLAGIGININQPPDIKAMGDDSALPASAIICEERPNLLPTPSQLWQALVRHIYSIYRSGSFFPKIWRDVAEELLLWRGREVVMKDGSNCVSGIFKGIGENGGALLEIDGQKEEIITGSMLLADPG